MVDGVRISGGGGGGGGPDGVAAAAADGGWEKRRYSCCMYGLCCCSRRPKGWLLGIAVAPKGPPGAAGDMRICCFMRQGKPIPLDVSRESAPARDDSGGSQPQARCRSESTRFVCFQPVRWCMRVKMPMISSCSRMSVRTGPAMASERIMIEETP